MIEAFFGEFLAHPVPLELSMNRCSHNCVFCFANLNQPTRKIDTKNLYNQLRKLYDLDTVAAQLLREKYPVCLSNRVDPFAKSNYEITLPVLEILRGYGIPVMFQTRGGYGIDEALDIVEPSVWYVSINQQDESLRERLEPQSTTLASRYELIRKITERGHRVQVAINPMVPDWIPNPEQLIENCVEAGAESFIMQSLHFSRDQVANISARGREALGDETILLGLGGRQDERFIDYYERLEKAAADHVCHAGAPFDFPHEPYYANMFYREVYDKVFPSVYDFLNVCYEVGPGIYSFAEWSAALMPSLPSGYSANMRSYIAVQRKRYANLAFSEQEMNPKAYMGYEDLLALWWNSEVLPRSPANILPMAIVTEVLHTGDRVVIYDENDMPYYAFDPAFIEEPRPFVDIDEYDVAAVANYYAQVSDILAAEEEGEEELPHV